MNNIFSVLSFSLLESKRRATTVITNNISPEGKIIIVRNEVAKVMFLQASVCPRGGGCLPQYMVEYTPPGADTPQEQTPPKSRHPWSRHPQGADIPPGADTHPWEQTPHPTPGSRHTPLGADTPWSRHPQQTCLGADTPPLGVDTPPEQTPRADTTPWEQTPPRADTMPPSRHPLETATAADGTHPTGMHSCSHM